MPEAYARSRWKSGSDSTWTGILGGLFVRIGDVSPGENEWIRSGGLQDAGTNHCFFFIIKHHAYSFICGVNDSGEKVAFLEAVVTMLAGFGRSIYIAEGRHGGWSSRVV